MYSHLATTPQEKTLTRRHPSVRILLGKKSIQKRLTKMNMKWTRTDAMLKMIVTADTTRVNCGTMMFKYWTPLQISSNWIEMPSFFKRKIELISYVGNK